MENYRIKIKRRMTWQLLGVVFLIPLAIFCVITAFNAEPIVSGTGSLDFIGGFFNGLRGAFGLGFILYLLIRFFFNLAAIKSEDKLREMHNRECDERNAEIQRVSCKAAWDLSIYLLLAACLVSWIFSNVVSLTILGVLVFLFIVRVVMYGIYEKKM